MVGLLRVALHLTAVAALWPSTAAVAAEISLNGVVGERALIAVDGGKPRWVAAGETTPEGVRLVSVGGQSAVVESGGVRRTLQLGGNDRLGAGTVARAGAQRAVLAADPRGHFVAAGSINGVAVRFLVDTGASFVSMSATEAKRLGLDYTAGQRGYSATANGVVPTFRIKLDEVRLGEITLHNVDAAVHTGDSPAIVLLGMSFLNRTEMQRDGDRMTLTRRF